MPLSAKSRAFQPKSQMPVLVSAITSPPWQSSVETISFGSRALQAVPVDRVRKLLLATATTLRRAERRFTFDAMMRSAKFNSDPVADASIRNALIASLSRTDTVYLLEHFQDAIEDDDLAKAYAVKVEFESRPKLSEGAKARFAKL